jgi:hypothetical protein
MDHPGGCLYPDTPSSIADPEQLARDLDEESFAHQLAEFAASAAMAGVTGDNLVAAAREARANGAFKRQRQGL